MNITEAKSILAAHKGQNLSAIFGKQLKTRKGVEAVVEKVSRIVVRGGIDYDNIKSVQEKRESGELPSENAGLPWGQWAEFPFHIQHKEQDYLRLYPASGLEFIPKVEYYLNGELSTKDAIESLVLKSELPKPNDERPDCMTIKVENIKAFLI
jgi:hypothetical protein